MILNDKQIRALNIVTPFVEGAKRPGKISYGLSSMGYDIRIGYKFRIFTAAMCAVVDPKAIDERAFVEVDMTPLPCEFDSRDYCSYCECGSLTQETDSCRKREQPQNYILVPPNSHALGESVETFTMPDDVLGICLGKSTYARCGVTVPMTPLEPGWTGKLTIELSNNTPLPAKVYCNEGICQVIFMRGERPQFTYADKAGKYQAQAGLTYAKVDV